MSNRVETATAVDSLNPLDNVEEILNANNWEFNRMTDEELMVQVTGSNCAYNLFFIWQEDMDALQFCVQYDMKIDDPKARSKAMEAVQEINENLWMGHFDLPKKTGIPSFRHTCLYRGLKKTATNDHIEDLVDISLAQCERHYPLFSLIAHGQNLNDQTMALAMMQTQGES